MKKQFVINKTLATLLFKNGYISIPRGGFVSVPTEDTVTYEFTTAQDRGWIDISDRAPTSVDVPAVETVVIENPNKGMTAEELKAELAKDEPKQDTVVVEALGTGAPAGSSAEATVEALGQDSTVEVTPSPEAAKPAAKTAKKVK